MAESHADVTAYLARSFERELNAALTAAEVAETAVLRKASAAGALQSGSTLWMVKSEREAILKASAAKITRLAFEATGGTAPEVGDVLEHHLRALRDKLAAQLADFYQRSSWARGLEARLQSEFHTDTDVTIEGIVDDFRHGISEGVRMKNDPLVNVVTSVSDSPGAVVQSGTGNVQRNISTHPTEIRSALSQFIHSPEVQALPREHRESLIDVTDVIEAELAKPQPDPAKLARWGQRLQGITENLGVAVAAEGIIRLIFGG